MVTEWRRVLQRRQCGQTRLWLLRLLPLTRARDRRAHRLPLVPCPVGAQWEVCPISGALAAPAYANDPHHQLQYKHLQQQRRRKKKKEKFTFTLFLFLSFNLRWIFFNNSFPPSPPLLPSNLFCMNWLTNKLFSLNFFSPFKSVDVCKWMTLNQSCEGFIIICYIEKSRVTCLHWPNFGFWWIQRCIE